MKVPILCTALCLSAAALFGQPQPLPPMSDPDGDGVPTIFERVLKTDPTRADTDGDFVMDGMELALGRNPRRATPRQDPATGARILGAAEDNTVYLAFLIGSGSNFARFQDLRAGVIIGTWIGRESAPNPTPVPIRIDLRVFASGTFFLSSDRNVVACVFTLPRSIMAQDWHLGLKYTEGVAATAKYNCAIQRLTHGLVITSLEGEGDLFPKSMELIPFLRPPKPGEPEECIQTLQTIEGPVKIVHDERCGPREEDCIYDCGEMIGRIVIFINEIPGWG